MTPNPLLAIAIPTYNRSEILRENLQKMLPQLAKHSIAVYLSDDSTDDHTLVMAASIRAEYPLIFYRKNQPRLGHDANCFATIAMPEAEYVWYLGDSQYFAPDTLDLILGALQESRPDMCFLNKFKPDGWGNRLIEGEAVHPFLLDRTWYLTLTGATIYGRVSRNLQFTDSQRASWKNFPQLGIILETCAQAPRRLLWIDSQVLKANNQKKTSYWLMSVFSVFVKDWSVLIRSFPTLFNSNEQERVIRSHALNTRLFSRINLLYLRSLGALTVDELTRHKEDFLVASPISPIWAQVIARVPQKASGALWFLKNSLPCLFRLKPKNAA